MRWLLHYADWTILAIAGVVIFLDTILPSWLTGSVDEYLLGLCVVAMRFTRRKRQEKT